VPKTPVATSITAAIVHRFNHYGDYCKKEQASD
jgi:hypothetical protein